MNFTVNFIIIFSHFKFYILSLKIDLLEEGKIVEAIENGYLELDEDISKG